jgi:3-methyladenine DNA glycosylase/8-oxoguanine DNA glycosylase
MADRRETFEPGFQLDLGLTLSPLRRGTGDPALRLGSDEAWRATRTPEGPATQHLVIDRNVVRAETWGPGAECAMRQIPGLLGWHDYPDAFSPSHPVLVDINRRLPGLRMVRSQAVFETLVPTVLEQKVVGWQARRAYAGLLRMLGEPAPGPVRLTTPPSPARWVDTPYWIFHRFDVERRRADVIRNAAVHAARLEETLTMEPAAAQSRIRALPGLGPWTAAEVARTALGDADAVSVGDFHLPHVVSWALEGRARGDDARMLQLLEPYRGHRGRVQRLLELGGVAPPRFGPRMPFRHIAQS